VVSLERGETGEGEKRRERDLVSSREPADRSHTGEERKKKGGRHGAVHQLTFACRCLPQFQQEWKKRRKKRIHGDLIKLILSIANLCEPLRGGGKKKEGRISIFMGNVMLIVGGSERKRRGRESHRTLFFFRDFLGDDTGERKKREVRHCRHVGP